jgi:hypothetical protein
MHHPMANGLNGREYWLLRKPIQEKGNRRLMIRLWEAQTLATMGLGNAKVQFGVTEINTFNVTGQSTHQWISRVIQGKLNAG